MYKNLLKIKVIYNFLQFIISILFFYNSRIKKKYRWILYYTYKNEKKKEIAHLIKDKYSDCYCIFSRYGLGDIFFVASLIKEFKKHNNGKCVWFTEKKRLVKFLQAFPSIDKVILDKDINFLQEEQTMQRHLTKGILNKLYFPYRGSRRTYTFSDNYNNLLDLPLDSERELPQISSKNYAKAEDEFKKLKINPKKTILIVPEATMFDYRILDKQFWINLADKFTGLGYNVIFNSKTKYKNYKRTFLPVLDFIAFAGQIDYIVSFRSGVSDLLAGMNMFNMSVIYPPNLEVIWADAIIFHDLHKYHVMPHDNELDNLFGIHSLNATFKTDKIDEIIYNYDDEKIIERIIENCKK